MKWLNGTSNRGRFTTPFRVEANIFTAPLQAREGSLVLCIEFGGPPPS